MAMTAPATEALITGEEPLEIGDIGPCELFDGRIIPMSPTGSEHDMIETILTAKMYSSVSSKTALVYRTPTEMSAFGPGETVAGEGALDCFAGAIYELFDE